MNTRREYLVACYAPGAAGPQRYFRETAVSEEEAATNAAASCAPECTIFVVWSTPTRFRSVSRIIAYPHP